MTDGLSTGVDKVVRLVRSELADPADWTTPDGYPGDIEAAILDAVFSSQAVYSDDENKGPRGVVTRWRARPPDGKQLQDYERYPEALSHILENAAKQNGRKKSEIAAEIAHRFADGQPALTTVEALKANTPEAKRRWTAAHGAGPATFHYFCLLLGLPDVKADTWVIRFVARALGADESDLTASQVRALAIAAADELEVNPIYLDHAIWRHESGR